MPLFGQRPTLDQISTLWERGHAPRPDYTPTVCRCGRVGTLRRWHTVDPVVRQQIYFCRICFRIVTVSDDSGLQCWHTREIQCHVPGQYWE